MLRVFREALASMSVRIVMTLPSSAAHISGVLSFSSQLVSGTELRRRSEKQVASTPA